jgi:NAD(P)-dependent dehydrogenase (short-subunit alcohol dehydrogenase family)
MPALSMFDLSRKTALVTGASRGIGRRLAEALASAGADVAVAARTESALAETVEAITALGRRAVPVVMDVSDVAQCRQGTQEAGAALGGLDILVNNAGIEEVRPSLDVDEGLWDKIFDTNLKGAFFCAQAAAKIMTAEKPARGDHQHLFAHFRSGDSNRGPLRLLQNWPPRHDQALSAEWAQLGIRVNAIAPGYFRTAMTEVFYEDVDWQERMLSKVPFGRFGELDDLIGATIFLASDASGYVTGQCLAVDGGFLASA